MHDALACFTHHSYKAMLRRFQDQGYAFSDFPSSPVRLANQEIFALLRHDIDMDLSQARRMAEIEAELEVSSTFFFLIGSEHYNVLSEGGSQEVRRILNLGHRLGLHFDAAAYPGVSVDGLAEACRKECEILERWFGQAVEVVSFHRPCPLVLTGNPALSAPRLHTYMPLFTREIHYCSDSRGEWRHGHPVEQEAFANKQPMHVLIHPIWWCESAEPPRTVLDRFLERRLETLKQSVAKNCVVYREHSLTKEAA